MKKIIIDCDPGIDDAFALLFAMNRSDARILGIVTSVGNVNARQGAENALRIIKLANLDYEIPVAVGAEVPLNGIEQEVPWIVHGRNGIGDVEIPPSDQKILDESGADFIVRTVRENPGEITLVVLGRMTDVALALRKEPNLPKMLKNIVAMGGTLYGPGNVGPMSEANMAGDPEAADIVFSAGFDVLMIGLDVTANTFLRESHLDYLVKRCRPENKAACEFISAIHKDFYIPFYRKWDCLTDCCPLHDPLAVLAALDPSPFVIRKFPIHVECGGTYTRGQMIPDLRSHHFDVPHTEVAVDCDHQMILETILSGF